MSQDTAFLIREAQQAIRQGQKQQARHLLQQALQQDPNNFASWLLLASIARNAHTALAYIARAETLNPTSTTVQKARIWAETQLRQEQVVAPKAQSPNASWRQRPLLRWSVPVGLFLLTFLVLGLTMRSQFSAAQDPGANDQQPEQVVAAYGETSARFELSTGFTATAVPEAIASVVVQEEDEGETAVTIPAATPTPTIIRAKPIGQHYNEPRPTWTLTPVPTPTPTPTITPVPTFVGAQSGPVKRPFGVGPKERWIDINLSTQTLVAYEGDTPVLNTLISSGTWRTPTVTGQFRIYLTYTSQTMDGRRLGYDYYLENVPYVMYFYKDYALHGTFWHNNFGTPMSHGCVNMRTSEAEWLFYWASIGTLVNVHY